jgi:signal peptidase I
VLGGLVAFAAVALVVGLLIESDGDSETYVVPSEAMEPTYSVEDEVTVNLDAYDDDDPVPGDVVVFNPPAGVDAGEECGVRTRPGEACAMPAAGRSSQSFLKRVIAGPGDTLAIKDGRAIVDGKAQEEPYAAPCGSPEACDMPRPITIPPGHYFMLGDNRGASADSRFWGPVPAEWILGRVE